MPSALGIWKGACTNIDYNMQFKYQSDIHLNIFLSTRNIGSKTRHTLLYRVFAPLFSSSQQSKISGYNSRP